MITYGSTTLTSYNTITKIEVYYYKSTSATSLSGGSWSTTKPTWENGKYIWQKIRTTYEGKLENGQYYSESDPVNITGQQGQQGETGASAYSYKLNASDTIVSVSKNGVYSTNSITFSATSKQGNENVNPYKGRFKIETTTDGITWTTQYTSSTNESSKTFTIPENITNIRCSLYQADGTTVLLDITSVSIVRDGTDATGLKDSIPFYLASDKETDITIYDEGWSTIRPALDATNKYLWVYYLSRYSNGTTDPELIEVSGDIATFENNGDISPIYSTEVDIEPIQDLNGFDHAWNGGDGKNLLVYPYYSGDTYTSHGLTFTVEKYPNGAIKDVLVNGTSDASTFFNFSAWANSSSAKTDMSKYCGQSMILSGGTSDARIVMQYRKPNSTSNIYLVNDTGGSGVTFTVPDASDLGTWAIFISISSGLTFNNVRVYPMLRFASETDGTYEPYENICSIDGWNSVKIERTGKNLLGIKYPNRTNNGITFTVNGSEIIANGTATANAWSSANLSGITSNLQYKNLIPPGQYMLTGGKSTDKRVYLTGNYLNGKGITVVNDYGNGALYTLTDWAYVYPQVQINNGVTVENEVFNIQLEATTIATEYESYNGNTYEIDFPTEAGTIFKGKLVIDENGDGQLIQTHEYKTLVGNDVAGIATTENVTRFYTNATYLSQDIISCDSYEIDSSSLIVLNKIGKMSGDTRIFCTPTWLQGATTKAEAQALLDINPINIVIELAEPIIYYLTAKQILALLKTNHIYANTGNTTVRYYDNQRVTVPYIDYSATSAFEYSAEALGKINNLKIGGRNLFGIGSDCAVSLGGLIAQNFSIVTEDGYKCAHAIGALKTTAYIQSKIPFIPKPLERVVFSADIKIKNIELGTTNPMCEFYFSGQNIDGAWRTIKSAETYVDGELISIANRKFNTILNSNEWHRVTVKAQFPDVIYTNNILPAIYLRDSTGEIFVKNVKYERGTQATDWTPAPEDVENSIKAYTESIQSQVDGMAEIHYGTVVPTLSNTPYTSWEDTETKDMHLDDLYYNTSTGYCYRFTKSGSTYSWTRIKDSDITAAATAASNANTAAGNAQTTANNANTLAGQKRRIFVAQPTPPYEVGDLWVEGSNGDIKKCKTARATGSYTASDWELASKYTDDTLASEANDKIDNLEIGGRNLLKGTGSPTFVTSGATFDNNWRGMSGGNGTFSIAEIDDSPVLNVNKSFRIMNNTTGNRDFVQWLKEFSVNWGGKWIFSCYARGIGGSARALIRSWNNTDGNAALAYYQTISEATWTKIIVKIPEDIQWNSSADSTDNLDFRFGLTGAGSIEYVAPKLERGNKVTDWTPAPEDMQTDIDTALAQSIWYATCSDAGATKSATITPVTTNFVLNVGTTVNVKFNNTNTGAVGSLTLNINNTGAKNIKYIYNKTLNDLPGADYIIGGRTYLFVYDGTYWVIQNMNYNTNTYDRRQHSGAITAKTAIAATHLIVGDSTGYQQITSTSGGTLEFDLGYPILWAYSKIDATKTSNATYEAYPSVNFSTSGTIQEGAANKMLWLKGTIRGNIFTLASTNFLTTQIPTSDDGMYYIPLGIMSSATAGYFSSSNRIYAYIDEEFQPLDNAAALKASSAYETAVQARSEIVQTQQTLSLQIRDISVGGANLFERTKTFEGTANQSTAHDLFTEFVYKDLTVKSANTVTFGNQVVELSAYQYTDLTSNMWYSFSFYAKGNVDIGFMYAGTGNAVIDSIDVSWDDNTYTGFNTTSTSSNIIWLTPTNNWQRYSVVFHIEEQDITALHRLIGLYARPVSSYTELSTENKDILITETGTDVHLIMEGNEVQICGYKLELGNKPTDWTPADNDKATYDNIISQINLSKEGIAIRADKIRLEGMITANEGFSIDEYGNMTANNGTFNGIFESYATEINENTFDLSINNGHIQFYNNNRALTKDERYVGYIGGIRKNTTFTDGSAKNNDAITIGLYNNSDFLINVYDDNTPTKLCEILNYTTSKPTFNFWLPACIYNGNKLQMFNRSENHGSQIEFRRYSSNTGGYVSRGSLSLHSIQDNSDISDRLYLLSKNQGNDLAGDQFLYFAGKGLRYSSSGQPMRTGYVATDKYIVTQDFSLSNQTIAKNTSQNFTIDISRDGYTPIMCVPKVGGGSGAYHLSIYSWGISGNIATIYTHNNSSSYDVSDVTIRVQVLYKLTY